MQDRQQAHQTAQKQRRDELQPAKLERLCEQQAAHHDTCVGLLKHVQHRRKAARHALRAAADGDDATLSILARESQNDRSHLKHVSAWLGAKTDALEARRKSALEALERAEQAFESQREQLIQQRDGLLGVTSFDGQTRALNDFFQGRYQPLSAGLSPACKLLRHAQQNSLSPLTLCEFWWGPSPDIEVRHHGQFYPCARGSDGQLLPFMLQGIERAADVTFTKPFPADAFTTVYEDECLLVVEKPAGMLSTPGKQTDDSVLDRLRARLPDASGPLLLHRLDLSTSGLLLAAKDEKTHKALQQQFIQRKIKKRYVAILDGDIAADEGLIDLPVRVDLDDRPRQVVCDTFGKSAQTRWQVVERIHGGTRVHLYPVTGRTHQLRLHTAHARGLGTPIVGDELYGRKDDRLLLHAERLTITHPDSGEQITFTSPAPF